jgi:uncharacterized membrane protein YhaH (DUF805 family)
MFYVEFWKKYLNKTGRTRRRDFFLTMAINSLIYILLSWGLPTYYPSQESVLTTLATYWNLLITLPTITLYIRRLHDTGRSGYYLLVGLIPIIGCIVLLVYFLMDSEPRDNQYGPNPKNGPYPQDSFHSGDDPDDVFFPLENSDII